jgi:hypothetical protein
MLGLRKILKLRWAVLITVAVVSWQLYDKFRPRPVELDQPRQDIARKACWAITKQLPSVDTPRKLLLTRLRGDHTGFVSDTLRESVGRSAKFDILSPSLLVRVLAELGVQEKEPYDLDSAMNIARKTEANYLLDGQIDSFASDEEQGRIAMSITLYRVSDQTPVVPSIQINLPDDSSQSSFSLGKWAGGVLAWLLAVFFLPFVFYAPVKKAMASESNGIIFLALLALSLTDTLLAWAISGLTLGWIMLAAALLISAGANYGILTWIDNNR